MKKPTYCDLDISCTFPLAFINWFVIPWISGYPPGDEESIVCVPPISIFCLNPRVVRKLDEFG